MEALDKVYYYIGMWVIWLGIAYVLYRIISFVFISLINFIGKHFDRAWHFIEFLYYRKDFKEWVKDKDRINED